MLDNCEHILEVCAHLADTLLKKAARLKMIVSSRQALEISGESTFRVPSLSAPDPHQMPPLPEFKEYEAVRLFSQRAQAVLPSFQVDEHNAPAIAQICQQLDGIPLALELAAARLSLLGPSQLASRLNDALRLLSGSNRTAMPRQQTLRATIDWSYQLLSEQEQCLLKRLAIFAGGATLEAIESICAGYGIVSEEILDLVNGLANKSMVSVEQFHDSEPRYQLLETVRQYAGEKLVKAGECATFEERRLEYYLNLVETFEPLLRTPVALERLKDLNREAGNLRACLSWSLDRGTIPMIEAGLRMASALWDFWHNQNYIGEGLAWLTKGLNRLPEHAPAFLKTRAKACFAAGWLTGALGRQQDTIQWWDKSLEIYRKLDSRTDSVMVKICLCEIHAWVGDSSSQVKKLCEESLEDARSQNDPWLLAFTLHHYGLSAEFLHEYFLARQLLEESLSICEKVGDRFQRGNILISIGVISYFQGDYSKARKYLVEALDAGQELESDWIIGNALGNLAEVDYMQGEYLQMETNLRFALEIFRKYGNNLAIIWTLRDIGIALKCQGKFQQALEYFLMTLPLAREQKDSYGVYTAIAGVARALASLGYTYRAVRLLGAVETLLSTFTKPMNPHELKEFKKDILVAKAALSEVDFSIAWVEGCSLTLEAAIQETLSSGIENQFRQ